MKIYQIEKSKMLPEERERLAHGMRDLMRSKGHEIVEQEVFDGDDFLTLCVAVSDGNKKGIWELWHTGIRNNRNLNYSQKASLYERIKTKNNYGKSLHHLYKGVHPRSGIRRVEP